MINIFEKIRIRNTLLIPTGKINIFHEIMRNIEESWKLVVSESVI